MNKKTIIIVVVVLSILILLVFKQSQKNKINNFEIKGEYVEEINQYLDTLEKNLNDQNLNFKSEKSKNYTIYSMLITIEGNELSKSFLSYNIDLNTKKSLNNQEVASEFGYTLDDIYEKINQRLLEYYNEEVKEGYVNSTEYDFENYKLSYRNIEDIESSYVLYVSDNRLNIYISFDIDDYDMKFFKNLNYNPFKIQL